VPLKATVALLTAFLEIATVALEVMPEMLAHPSRRCVFPTTGVALQIDGHSDHPVA
jgi:hypothetical protein